MEQPKQSYLNREWVRNNLQLVMDDNITHKQRHFYRAVDELLPDMKEQLLCEHSMFLEIPQNDYVESREGLISKVLFVLPLLLTIKGFAFGRA